jgi:excisionase family DNA binding protein
MPSDEERLTLPQIAELLGVNPSTVRHWVNLGRLPAEKQGRKWVVQRSEVERLLATRHRRQAVTDPPDLSTAPVDERPGLSMASAIGPSS